MSASAPTMKTFQKRLYTALPRKAANAAAGPSGLSSSPPSASSSAMALAGRARSGSLSHAHRTLYTSSFFDAGTPGGSRGPVARLEGRVELELPGGSVHQTHQSSSTSVHGGGPYSISNTHNPPNMGPPAWHMGLNTSAYAPQSVLPSSAYPYLPQAALPADAAKDTMAAWWSTIVPDPTPPVPQPSFHLDVGAYGIPKRQRGGRSRHPSYRPRSSTPTLTDTPASASAEDLSLSVQVGEDAYFIRHNAMGVGDGVGGWTTRTRSASDREHSASALFARRLMHFCSAELDGFPITEPAPPVLSKPSRARSTSPPPRHRHTFSPVPQIQALHEQLEHELDELADGLDVLKILESAYEKTLRAHVEMPMKEDKEDRLCPALKLTTSTDEGEMPKPLMAGSTTALLAILDNAPMGFDSSAPTSGAVLRIAHLGDSMGMLVRGEEIVWRSEEQWSSWNTPVQLGPRAGTKPAEAVVLSVPVQADDILVLATDGLSDNLWDEQVLAEVVRFRRQFLADKEDSEGVVGRRAMAGMLSEALCSLARRVSEKGHGRGAPCAPSTGKADEEVEIPFTKRAREHGKSFHGGKADDISVVVAVISPS